MLHVLTTILKRKKSTISAEKKSNVSEIGALACFQSQC